MASSYENHEPIFEDFFRIKSAGSSNYRGSVFLLPEFTPGVCLLAFLPGATFFASGKKQPNIEVEDPPSSGGINQEELPIMSIENPTLAHFRHFSSLYFTLAHFRHFSSLFTNSPLYICRESSTNQPFLCKTNPISGKLK